MFTTPGDPAKATIFSGLVFTLASAVIGSVLVGRMLGGPPDRARKGGATTVTTGGTQQIENTSGRSSR